MSNRHPKIGLAIAVALLAAGLATATPAKGTSFSNTDSIPFSNTFVPDDPSTIEVSCLAGAVTKVTATLNDIDNTLDLFPLAALLQAPSGQTVVLVGGVGYAYDQSGRNGITGLDLTLDDAAPTSIPEFGSDPVSGSYKPSQGSLFGSLQRFPQPGAPPRPWGTTMSALNGSDANGTWKLWITNVERNPNEGHIAGGFSLDITSDGAATATRDGEQECKTPHYVTFEVTQTGVQTEPELGADSNVISTATQITGTVFFEGKPKPYKQSSGKLTHLTFTQTDTLLLPDFTTQEVRASFGEIIPTKKKAKYYYYSGTTFSIPFTLEIPVELLSYEGTGCKVGGQARVELVSYLNIEDHDLFEVGKAKPKKACSLNRLFEDEDEGENSSVHVSISYPEP